MPKLSKIIRHELDPVLVAEQLDKFEITLQRQHDQRIDWHEKALANYVTSKQKLKPPIAPCEELLKLRMKECREYHSSVRVLELPQQGKRFVLAYGDAPDSDPGDHTGPFQTLDEAAGWFLRGGR